MAILIHQNVLFLVMIEANYLQPHCLCLLLTEPGWDKEACMGTGFLTLFFRPCQNIPDVKMATLAYPTPLQGVETTTLCEFHTEPHQALKHPACPSDTGCPHS